MTDPLISATEANTDPDTAEALPGDDQLDELFERWSHWSRTRRHFAPPASSGNLLGKLRGATRPSRPPPNAKCSSNLAALHLAILGQPADALDTQVFWAYYGHRAAHIKQTAAVLGISRQHFYRLLRAFGKRVVMAAKQIEADNLAANANLPHYSGPVAEED